MGTRARQQITMKDPFDGAMVEAFARSLFGAIQEPVNIIDRNLNVVWVNSFVNVQWSANRNRGSVNVYTPSPDWVM